MTLLSHSPTDMPDRCAPSRAASTVTGRRPLRFHGAPGFIGRKSPREETWIAPAWHRGPLGRVRAEGAVVCPHSDFSGITVNKPLIAARGPRSRLPPSYAAIMPFHRRSPGVNPLRWGFRPAPGETLGAALGRSPPTKAQTKVQTKDPVVRGTDAGLQSSGR